MKVILKMTVALGMGLPAACIGYGEQGVDPFEGEGLPEAVELCEGCVADQPLRGELMVFVNAKLSGVDSNFTSNYPLDNEGRFVGNAMYVYDPTLTCPDGGSGCRLARLGNLWLGDAMGPLSLDDQSLQRFSVRDLAWHPERGLWGLSYDPLNDEWGLTTLAVSDWGRADNRVEAKRYAFRYGDIDEPATDDCYWRQSLTGLAFVGDELWVGSAGKPGNGLDARGAIFRVDPEFVRSPSHCEEPHDVTHDPVYYACGKICSVWTTFEEKLGIAGDMVESRDDGMLALVRGEDPAVLPTGQNALFEVPLAAPDQAPTHYGPYIADLAAGLDIEGLARIKGELYGINTAGTVFHIVEPPPGETSGWTVEIHDELGPLFTAPDLSVRIRGAARVVIE
ncbi:MAG: hypothetical protein H0T76_19540 [Nannocystis sp.]|nr:hypothetical protein [Nannocystis sp.]MBA3548685.1 hypothetical protein [Nannocystis sp.]